MSEPHDNDLKAKLSRSPSFPFISLKRAVERVRELAENHKRSPARLQAVGPTWGYGLKSSGLSQTIAALKQFSLIIDMGSGDDRKIQISDLGWKFLFDERPGERESALRTAAFSPKLIAEYFVHWGRSRPTDAHCVSELQFDRGFTGDAARNFLRVYDETVDFANLRDGDKTDTVSDEGGEVPPVSAGVEAVESPRSPVRTPFYGGGAPISRETSSISPTAPIGVNRATFPLPEGVIALEFPEGLSKESLEDVKAWIEIILRRAQRGAALSEKPSSGLDQS